VTVPSVARGLIGALAVAAAVGLGGCSALLGGEAEPKGCEHVHNLEAESRDDIALLGRLVVLEPKPLSAKWTRGRLGGADKRVPGGGDWELVALLQYAEADANQLTDARSAEVVEVELPATPWVAEAIGTQIPPHDPQDCVESTIRLSGLGYDGSLFEQYFLKSQTFLKVSGSAYFVLWLATRPMTPQALAVEQATSPSARPSPAPGRPAP